MTTDPKQPPLPGLDYIGRAAAISKRASKQRRRTRLPVLQPTLAVSLSTFEPSATVPRTRGDCPVQRPCPHLKCRYHLHRIDAEHRAGRPGLSNVPRDEHGHTLSAPGHAGPRSAGTTYTPRWMETERTCRAALEIDQVGNVCAVNILGDWMAQGTSGNGEETWRAMRLHEGEELRVVAQDGTWATRARYVQGELKLERQPLIGQVVAVLITRVRGVPSCALDEIDRVGRPMTNEETGDAYARHRTLSARDVKSAMERAKEVAEGMGMSEAELLRGLRELGAGR